MNDRLERESAAPPSNPSAPPPAREGELAARLATSHDSTTRTRVEAALRESERQLGAELEIAHRLRDLSTQLVRGGDIQALCDQMLDAASAIMRSDFASMQILVADGGGDAAPDVLSLLAWRGFHPESARAWSRVPLDAWPVRALALRAGQRFTIADTERLEPIAGTADLDEFRRSGIRSVQSTPLISRSGQLLGVISTHWREPHEPSAAQTSTFDILARQVADLLDRQRAEEALRRSQERLQRVANIPGVGVLTWALPSGILLDANDAFLDMFGYSREEVRSGALTWRVMTPPEFVEESERQLAIYERTGRIGPYEKEYLRKDGSRSWMLFAGASLGDGTLIEYCIDVSDRKRAEAALREAKEAAEKANRVKTQFLSTLSHELRTPLTAVIGLSDLMELDVVGPTNERQKEYLGRMKASAWHLVSIIDEILTFSLTEAGKETVRLEPTDVAAIARSVVDLLRDQAQSRRLQLTLRGADTPLLALTDGGKVRQIVVNLVGNALRYTVTGSVDVGLDAGEDALELCVRDTGPGIPAERLGDIFDAFVQLDGSMTREHGGTGLGLTICRRLARLLGGDVSVESTPGVGSTFTVRLPRSDPRAGAGA